MQNQQLSNVERLKLYHKFQNVFNKPTSSQYFIRLAKDRVISTNQLTNTEIWISIAISIVKNNKMPIKEKFKILNSIISNKKIICTSVILAFTQQHISYTEFEFIICKLFK